MIQLSDFNKHTLPEKVLILEQIENKKDQKAIPLLLDMVDGENNDIVQLMAFSALKLLFQDNERETIRGLHSENIEIQKLCIEVAGEQKYLSAIPILIQKAGLENDPSMLMPIIIALSCFDSPQTLAALTAMIDHENPMVRRLIGDQLSKAGNSAVPCLIDQFSGADTDTQIQIAGILGKMGSRQAIDTLVDIIEKMMAHEVHLKQAIYETLGKLSQARGQECLLAGLQEEDDGLLKTIVSCLDKMSGSRIIDEINEIIILNPRQGDKILKAIVLSKSLNLFSLLYEDSDIGHRFLEIIEQLQDIRGLYSFPLTMENVISVFM